jgi:hypothetical protein
LASGKYADDVVEQVNTITVRGSPSADGTVSGGGTFAEGTLQTVTATPNGGNTFVHWIGERARGQHVRELHVHAQRQRHPSR